MIIMVIGPHAHLPGQLVVIMMLASLGIRHVFGGNDGWGVVVVNVKVVVVQSSRVLVRVACSGGWAHKFGFPGLRLPRCVQGLMLGFFAIQVVGFHVVGFHVVGFHMMGFHVVRFHMMGVHVVGVHVVGIQHLTVSVLCSLVRNKPRVVGIPVMMVVPVVVSVAPGMVPVVLMNIPCGVMLVC